MKPFTFKGLMAPVFAPFNEDETLNEKVILPYANQLKAQGIEGLLINGTSGEGMSLNIKERNLIVELWIKARAQTKQHIMVQVGGAPLPDVLEMAKHAEQNGADSILCLPELYIKPNTPEDLVDYLTTVSNAAPNTPLLYYHIPMFTNVKIHMGSFLRNHGSKIPTLVGIKFTSTLLDEGIDAVNACNKKFSIFLGADTNEHSPPNLNETDIRNIIENLLLPALTSGFDSAIATTLNIIPSLSVAIINEVKNKNLEEAKKAQDKITIAVSEITKNGGWVPTMKTAMNLISPIKVGNVRKPLKRLTTEHVQEMIQDIKKIL